MNKLRNKLYKYEFISMILGVVLFLIEMKMYENYPRLVSSLISPLSNIFIYISMTIVLFIFIMETISVIKSRDFDILLVILIIIAIFFVVFYFI